MTSEKRSPASTKGSKASLTERVHPGAPGPKTDGSQRDPRCAQRKAYAIIALSLVLVVGSVIYFAAFPKELSFLTGGEGVLQTTASPVPDVGSAAASTESDDVGPEDQGGDEENDTGGDSSPSSDQSSTVDRGNDGASSSEGTASSEGTGSEGGGTQQAPAPAMLSIQVVVDSSSVGGSVSANTTVSLNQGATAYDALCGTGLSVNASGGPMGIYVRGIGGLAEFDHGSESGWKYSVNGSTPGYASSAYILNDGDVVRWFYVTSL